MSKRNSYRTLSLEACDIYRYEKDNGSDVGMVMPLERISDFFWLFNNKLDYSLDTIRLEEVYKEICGDGFSYPDERGNNHTLAVVNVKFNYAYKDLFDMQSTLMLRERLYENGFCINGVHYVRYKRSAGSSRQGKCLFIDERLYGAMSDWSECGLEKGGDLASWESYKALSLSSIKHLIDIPIDGILFVPDRKTTFSEEVVSVSVGEDGLTAEEKREEVTNDIWDGESLLDESFFSGEHSSKHMLLLRNRFFKSCAFRTKLKKWIKDRGITLDDLKSRGFVTLAPDIDSIVMVTTPNSLKYLKFAGGLSYDSIRSWADHVDSTFGIVKWDKRTRYFAGRMVRSSYQLFNTLGLNEEQADDLMRPSLDYVSKIRGDIDFMRYHFSDVCAKESDEEDIEPADGLAERADVIFRLMQVNNGFCNTKLYSEFRNDMVKNQKDELKEGHILLSGTNATLFGNGPELLQYIAGDELKGPLGPGQIRCGKFGDGQRLLCARSPHITMGNLYLVKNVLGGGIWDYFDLGENIVCVNAIGENIQQKLNGCDYDSDTMLLTDDERLIDTADKNMRRFKVPVCDIPSSGAANLSLARLDYNTSENKIGEIVNLSQKLNSMIWDRLNHGNEDIHGVYMDVCKLAVLSGLEIDKAKKAYDNVNSGMEIKRINDKYDCMSPTFFKAMDDKRTEKEKNKEKKRKRKRAKKGSPEPEQKPKKQKKPKEYDSYYTAMEYIYNIAGSLDFRKGKTKFAEYVPISSMLNVEPLDDPKDIAVADKIIEVCDSYKKTLAGQYLKLRSADESERDVIYDKIKDTKKERDETVAKFITNENILIHIIKHYETNKVVDWRYYAPVLNSKMFAKVLKESKEKLATISEDPFGGHVLYDFRYKKH